MQPRIALLKGKSMFYESIAAHGRQSTSDELAEWFRRVWRKNEILDNLVRAASRQRMCRLHVAPPGYVRARVTLDLLAAELLKRGIDPDSLVLDETCA